MIAATRGSKLTRPNLFHHGQQKRHDLLARLASARQIHESLKTELEAHGAADPVKFAEKKRAVESAKEASLRWTGECNMLAGKDAVSS